MGRTWKDRPPGTILKVVKNDDGTLDVFLNRVLDRANIHLNQLENNVCGRFGYCQDEYDEILRELERDGQAIRYM